MKVFCTLLFSIILFSSGFTQNSYILDKEQSKVTIQGTSTVHDWESVVEEFSVNTKIASTEEGSIDNIFLIYSTGKIDRKRKAHYGS